MVSKKGMNPAALAALKANRGALQQGQAMPKKPKSGRTAAERSTTSFVEAVIPKSVLPGVIITEPSSKEAEAGGGKRKDVPLGKGKGPIEPEGKKQKLREPLAAHNDGPSMLLDHEFRLSRFRGLLTPPDKKILETFESQDLFKDTVARSIEVISRACYCICLSLFHR